MPAVASEKGRPSQHRRASKPLMEKRRRARINQSLAQLEGLVLQEGAGQLVTIAKDTAQQRVRHSKLEKADILELTVRHLQRLSAENRTDGEEDGPASPRPHTAPSLTETRLCPLRQFRAGFNECAREVSLFRHLESGTRRRLLSHLSSCLGGLPPQSEDPASCGSSEDGGSSCDGLSSSFESAPASGEQNLVLQVVVRGDAFAELREQDRPVNLMAPGQQQLEDTRVWRPW